MEFKLDDITGQLIDLTPYSPRGLVTVPKNEFGLDGGGYFTIAFISHEAVTRHLMNIHNLDTGESQTYEYKRGLVRITGECYLKEVRWPSSGEIKAVFVQTGTQAEYKDEEHHQ